jgi:hypothetical protein
MKLYNLNLLGFTPLQYSLAEHHSLILFKNMQDKEVLYSVGSEANDLITHLGVETEAEANEAEEFFRPMPIFVDRKVISFLAHDKDASVVLLDGDVQDNLGLYHHQLPGLKEATGLVHFYKTADKWTYLSQDEYQAKKAELPAISFVIRCPIKDIENKEWPDLDKLTKDLLEDKSVSLDELTHANFKSSFDEQPVKGALYYSKCLINNEEIEVCHSESSVQNEDRHSVNPHIFLRISRQVKEGVIIPSFDLAKFYD